MNTPYSPQLQSALAMVDRAFAKPAPVQHKRPWRKLPTGAELQALRDKGFTPHSFDGWQIGTKLAIQKRASAILLRTYGPRKPGTPMKKSFAENSTRALLYRILLARLVKNEIRRGRVFISGPFNQVTNTDWNLR